MGDDYIEKAFQYANDTDPNVELAYNDYNLYKPKKREGVIRIINSLKEKGINASFATVRGVVVLKGTPPETIAKLEKGFLKAMAHPVYQNYLTGAGLDASSVAGSAAWDAEIKKIYKEARAALVSLGLAK